MIPFIDMHCDTLTGANMTFQHDMHRLKLEQVDVERLVKGGAKAQFFAICLPKITTVKKLGPLYEGDWKHIKRLTGILHHTCRLHPDKIALCHNMQELKQNEKDGRISAILTIEDGRDICGDMKRLALYHRLGVRLITLTWNFPNCFGYPNSPYGFRPTENDRNKGLTAFGKEAVEEMNRQGILIDVSHLSDGGFWDVASLSKKPFVASHSNCRSVCDHPRNLTDEQIRAVAKHGGVIGLNQCPSFLHKFSKEVTAQDCLVHLLHMRDVGGIDCIALGADFDGCGLFAAMPYKGPQDYPMLADLMMRNGFTADEVEKVFYRNIERVMGDCL